jgi:hypothetical protein
MQYWDLKDKVDELYENNRKLLKEKEALIAEIEKTSTEKKVLEMERNYFVKLSEELLEKKTCIICCVAEKGAMVMPCGHASFCHPCIHADIQLAAREGRKAKCPICRIELTRYGQFFL